jgi:hypothetical protein
MFSVFIINPKTMEAIEKPTLTGGVMITTSDPGAPVKEIRKRERKRKREGERERERERESESERKKDRKKERKNRSRTLSLKEKVLGSIAF